MVMDTYHITQIVLNVLIVLIPAYYVVRKNSSKRTKIIAMVVLVFVVLALIGELGTYLEKHASTIRNNAANSTAYVGVDALSTKYTSPDNSFAISFPQYPNVTNSTQNDNGVQVQSNLYLASNSSNDTKYSVQTLDYPSYTNYIRDHQRQLLQQIMQQVNDSYSARVMAPVNNGYLCGFSASKEHFTYDSNGTTYDGYAVAVLDYNTFYVLINYGHNTLTFNNFVNSFVPKGGCKYHTEL